MSIAFSLAVYLIVGVAACAWLKSQARLPSGLAAHVTAVLVWPAYLPVSLAAAPRDSLEVDGLLRARDAAFESVRRQLQRMPLDPARRRDHLAVIDGLERAFTDRRNEIARWRFARLRLAQLAAEVGGDGCAFAAEECERLDRAAGDAERRLVDAAAVADLRFGAADDDLARPRDPRQARIERDPHVFEATGAA
jgi:hypothetical protein